MTKTHIYISQSTVEQSIYERMPGEFPKWVRESRHKKIALRDLAESIAAQYARGLTAEFIAEWQECPIGFVRAVKRTRAKAIKGMKEDLVFCQKAAERAIAHLDETASTMSDEAIKNFMLALAKTKYKL